MSLRLRLLLAVGAIAIVALVVADFATYSALRSSLYNQVDQELAAAPVHLNVDPVTGNVVCPSPQSDNGRWPSGQRRRPGGWCDGTGGDFANVFGISYIAVVKQSGGVVDGLECPAYVGNHPYRPAAAGTDQRVLDPARRHAGGLLHDRVHRPGRAGLPGPGPEGPRRDLQRRRPRAGAAARRPDQHPAHPLPDRAGRHRRRAGVRPGRRAGGWSASACARSRTSSARPTPSRRATSTSGCPGAEQSTEVGRLARALNVMLERIQAAFVGPARLRGAPEGVRAAPAPVRRRRLPRAAHARSPPCRPTPSCSSAAPPSTPRTCRGSMSGIRTETARMDRLVNDLLTLARLDEGVPMEKAPVELVSLASEAVRTATAVGPEWPVRFWAAHPVEVDRRQGPPAPGGRQPAGQRAGPHAAGDDDHRAGGPGRRRGRGRGARHGPGHARRGGPSCLRALLPGRPGPVPHQRGQRPGPLHRLGHRGRPRRHRRGRVLARGRA